MPHARGTYTCPSPLYLKRHRWSFPDGQIVQFDRGDVGTARARPQQSLQICDLLIRSARDDFNRSVRAIRDPSGEPASHCEPMHEPPEPNPLNPAMNDKFRRLHALNGARE